MSHVVNPDVVDSSQPFQLPRLTILHLMAWTAATALAFVPIRVQQQRISVPSLGSLERRIGHRQWRLSLCRLGRHVVAPKRLRRAVTTRSSPGIRRFGPMGAFRHGLGAFGATRRFHIRGLSADHPSSTCRVLIFGIWFIRLAFRPGESELWRWTFGVFALAPVVQFAFSLVLMFSRAFLRGMASGPFSPFFFVYWTSTALQAGLLAAAMIDDLRYRRRRHWSHWVGASARLSLALVAICSYVAYWLLV